MGSVHQTVPRQPAGAIPTQFYMVWFGRRTKSVIKVYHRDRMSWNQLMHIGDRCEQR